MLQATQKFTVHYNSGSFSSWLAPSTTMSHTALIVEDDPGTRHLLQETLTSAGVSLTHTYDSLGRLVKTTRKSGAILKDTT